MKTSTYGRLNNISIVWKIFLPMGFIAILGAVVSLMLLSGIQKSERFLRQLYENNMQYNLHLSDLGALFSDHQMLLLEHLAAEDAGQMSILAESMNQKKTDAKIILDTRLIEHGDEHLGSVLKLEKFAAEYHSRCEEIAALSRDFEKEKAFALLQAAVSPLLRQIYAIIYTESMAANKKMEVFYLQTARLQQNNSIVAWCFVIISVSIPVLAAILLARYFARQMQAVISYTCELGEGKLGASLAVTSGDEFGRLTVSLNAMGQRLAGYFNTLQAVNRQLAIQAEDLEKSRLQLKSRQQELERSNTMLQIEVQERRQIADELRKSRSYYQEFIEGTDDLITQVDEKGRFIFVNHMAETVFGLSPEECIGLSAFDFVHPEDRPETITAFQQWLTQQSNNISFDNRQVSRTGVIRVFNWTINRHYGADGKLTNINAIGKDITERKQTEMAMIKARQAAEEASHAKGQFLANMSHELRTPLNAIIGFSDLMVRGMAGPLGATQKEYLQDIFTSGQHLLGLINDILDLSKVEAGRMELELSEYDVADLIGRSLVLFQEKARVHEIRLKAEVAGGIPVVFGDERKIKQVIVNLVSNAVKFTPDGGSVTIRAKVAHDDETDLMEIAVADNGIGIATEDRDLLFQPFRQLAHDLAKKYEGTGLGLALCKEFVELHNGRIWVESEPGKGSTFTFRVPLRARKIHAADTPDLSLPGDGGHRGALSGREG